MASSGAPPTAGLGAVTVHGLFAVEAQAQTPFLLMARRDRNQVSALDLYRPATVENLIWWSIPLDGGPQNPEMRTKKKRFRRLRVYGEGTLALVNGGSVTFIADRGVRVETYPVSAASSDPTQDILILQESSPDMVGRQVEVLLSLNGTGLLLREVQMEFVVIN